MFRVSGTHTFFMPVDTAFDVSVQLSGYKKLITNFELSVIVAIKLFSYTTRRFYSIICV